MTNILVVALLLAGGAAAAPATLLTNPYVNKEAHEAWKAKVAHNATLARIYEGTMTSSFPHCIQKCGLWCWATVITEFMYFYGKADEDKIGCNAQECQVVTDTRGENCCGSDACTSGGPSSGCKGAGAVDIIIKKLNAFHSFSSEGVPSESDLQKLLSQGRPVARITNGHIDVVTSYSDGKYCVVDSMYKDPFCDVYSALVQSPYNPLAKWIESLVPAASLVVV